MFLNTLELILSRSSLITDRKEMIEMIIKVTLDIAFYQRQRTDDVSRQLFRKTFFQDYLPPHTQFLSYV